MRRARPFFAVLFRLHGPRRVALTFAALAVLLSPALLFAHAKLLRSSPAANASLASAPRSISLWFSERPELGFTHVELTGAGGAAIPLGAPAAVDSMGVALPITTLIGAGTYTVSWRTAAADGHATSGKLTFRVTTNVDSTTSAIPPLTTLPGQPSAEVQITHSTRSANSLIQTDTGLTLSSAMRWVELVAVLTLVGVVTFRLAVMPPARWHADSLRAANDRLRRLANASLVLFIVGTLTRAFTEADLLPFEGSRGATLLALVKNTQWGRGWAIGAAGGVVLLVALPFTARAFAAWIVAAVALIAVALGQTLTGHSIASSHQALAIATDMAHLLSAGGWLGGLAALVISVLPVVKSMPTREASDHGSRLLAAFHSTASECVMLVVITALVSAWLRLGAFSPLWTSRYGATLLIKTAVVVLALGLGWYHSRRVVPAQWTGDVASSFRRSAAAELIAGLIVVAVTAALLTTPLPK